MPDSPERQADESLPPGVIEVIKKPGGPTLTRLTGEEFERLTGVGNHISIWFGTPMPEAQPKPTADAGASVACPACRGRGYFDETPGGGATCVFCVGEGTVTAAEALQYDPDDPLGGAEPTLHRLKILIYQLDPTGIKYLSVYRLDPNRIKYPYRLEYPYLRARMWLDHYGFTLERLQAELDEDDLNNQLDDLWGFDGRQYAGEDFSAGSSTGSGNDRWDECDFSGSILTGANFHEVDLTDSLFNAADLTAAILTGANLTRASLQDANLSGTNLDSAILLHADLDGANFSGASLRGASLAGASLSVTTLANADVTGADFSGVKGLNSDALEDLQVRGAILDHPEN